MTVPFDGKIRKLPPGWVEAPLGEVVEILDHKRVPVNATARISRTGSVPYYGATGQVGWIDRPIFNEELVLLGEDGAPFLELTKPKAYVIHGPSWVNNHAHVLKGIAIDNTFLAQQLNTVDFHPFVSGTTRLKLPQGPMRQIALRVAPAKEQRRIVDSLDSYVTRLEAAIEGLRHAEANLNRYRASVLKAAVQGRLVPTEAELADEQGRNYEPASALLAKILKERRRRWEQAELAKMKDRGAPPANDTWKSRYEESEGLDGRSLPPLPDGWCWTTLDVPLTQSPQNGLYVPKTTYGNGTPILRINDFQSLRSVPKTEMQRVAIDQDTTRNYELRVRDVVINRVNSPSHLGKCISVDANTAGAVFESNMMRATPTDDMSSDYLCQYLTSLDGKARLTTNAKWAVNQASINQRDVRSTPVPLPPLREQIRISEEVSRLLAIGEHVAADVGSRRLACGRLRQAVLKWAFEGKLVDQDSADEPASFLLDRARQDHGASAKRTKSSARHPARKTA